LNAAAIRRALDCARELRGCSRQRVRDPATYLWRHVGRRPSTPRRQLARFAR
jgi:hypothetical protein